MEVNEQDDGNKTTDATRSVQSIIEASLDSSFPIQDYNSSSLVECKDVDVCDDVLECKMAMLELCEKINEDEIVIINNKTNGDGSDSGVETGISLTMNGVLQRALSSNSGGYASSCGGLEDIIGHVSCNSSMISYCSDTNEKINACYASEGGSESSSVTGVPTLRKQNCPAKKKVAVKEPMNKSPRKSNESNSSNRSRSRPPSVSRSNTLPSKSIAPNLSTRERARSRDKNTKQEAPKIIMTSSLTRSTLQNKRPPKPDSFPTNIKEMTLSSPSPRVNLSRTPSLTRGRTPLATPTNEDGRWPSIGIRSNFGNSPTIPRATRGGSAAPEGLIIRTRIGNIHLDNKSTFDKYATLPRRRKEKSAEDLKKTTSRSSSISRDGIPNRMTSSMIKKLPSKESIQTPTKALPAYPKIAKKPIVAKTKIYHETAVQTAITSKDVEDAFAGNAKEVKVDAVEMQTKETQSDIRDKEMEKLREKIDKMNADQLQLLTKLTEKSQAMTVLEQELLKEKEEKLTAQKELQNNTERVMNMLDTFQSGKATDDGDSLLMLESQLMMSGNVLGKQQEEIIKLQGICRCLQRDMERSLKVQENLIRQKNELEEESTELQDFLQAEKVAFMEALKEAETENYAQKSKLTHKEFELERLQEECRHLVRICEQRRQEYLGMQAKYNALENRSKDLLLSQGSAVSGASVALSGLGNRIEHLVDQLISSYNISEQDLEDIVFYNEAYSNSCSSGDGSPEFETAKSRCSGDLAQSPQRGQSFLAAVINAIRNATSSTAKVQINNKHQQKPIEAETPGEDESESTEMLDSETEPCLMMDNVLEDVQQPDSHSQNLVSTSQVMISQIEIPSDILKNSIQDDEDDCDDDDDNSLNNLSQAIADRQKIELQAGAMATRTAMRQQSDRNSTSDDISGQESVAEVPSIGDFCTAQSIVDQVIDVDNLVTKLLKVLRIIQLDNDNCIQELISDKTKLALEKENEHEKMKEWEMINQKLKSELKETTEQLIVKGNELTSSKSELQRHRNEIDRLNEDICNLSTLCSDKNANDNKSVDKDDILKALKEWQESGNLPEEKIVSHVVSACNEIPVLKEKLREKERQLSEIVNNVSNSSLVMTSSWHQAINEAKRQYEAIDRALETLHGIQTIVQDCPELAQLQRDLEETNFNTATSIPLSTAAALLSVNGNIMSSDMNANETMTNDNGPHIIDSTA